MQRTNPAYASTRRRGHRCHSNEPRICYRSITTRPGAIPRHIEQPTVRPIFFSATDHRTTASCCPGARPGMRGHRELPSLRVHLASMRLASMRDRADWNLLWYGRRRREARPTTTGPLPCADAVTWRRECVKHETSSARRSSLHEPNRTAVVYPSPTELEGGKASWVLFATD